MLTSIWVLESTRVEVVVKKTGGTAREGCVDADATALPDTCWRVKNVTNVATYKLINHEAQCCSQSRGFRNGLTFQLHRPVNQIASQ